MKISHLGNSNLIVQPVISKESITSLLDYYGRTYSNWIVMGDFNMESTQYTIKTVMENYNLYNLVKTKTCFKSTQGRCIDLILTNKKHSFKNTNTFETGLSDFTQ